MKNSFISYFILLGNIVFVSFCFLHPAFSQNDYTFKNTSLSFEERAKDLVSGMTFEEKILQMQYLSPAIPRLGINAYCWSNEGNHGVGNTANVTVFPQVISMAATFDTGLIKAEADAISSEARALYNVYSQIPSKASEKGLTYWAPNINIFRDPRWGRGQETYGEDPYLTSVMAVSFIKGMQGNDSKYLKVVATPKHFAVHSGPESLRHKINNVTSRRDLYETYLPAFEAAVTKGGAWSVMGAFNSYLGVPCCANSFLLNDILRNKWGFKGYVVSDCGAISDIYKEHKFTNDVISASAFSVKAGCDLNCGSEYLSLREAVQKGLLTEKDIDVSLTRLMLARMKLGMFDPPQMVPFSQIPYTVVDSKEHRNLALKIAEESMVLLKNENNVLPLDRNKIKSLLVIGPNADALNAMYGNYNGTPSHAVSVLDGIKAKVGDKVKVSYLKGCSLFDTEQTGDPIPPESFRGGLKAEFFNNMKVEGNPDLLRNDANIDFSWGPGSPGNNINSDHFSARWTGILVPALSGEYELVVKANDCARLFIDNVKVLDNWSAQQSSFIKAKFNFIAGKEYSIKLESYHNLYDAEVHLSWIKPGGKERYLKDVDANLNKWILDNKNLITSSDAIIFVGGISSELEGEQKEVLVEGFNEGDRTSLDLPLIQQKYIKEIFKLQKRNFILILMNGSALSLNWENENLPAILEAWYPGEEGGTAVADILFGDYNPAGRLPVTFYRSVFDLPPFEDYKMDGRTYRYFRGVALYPFGHGLSYTKFYYSGLNLDKNNISSKDSVLISFKVKNSGNYNGDEVAQLYLKNLDSKLPQPVKSLKGFKRITLKKGEAKTVKISLKAQDLQYYDEANDKFIVEPGRYQIQVGASSGDIKLYGDLILK